MILNPQKVFAGSARQTALPFNKRYPLNTREAFSIVDVNKSGIFQIEKSEGLKTYDRCYVFSDINYKIVMKMKRVQSYQILSSY